MVDDVRLSGGTVVRPTGEIDRADVTIRSRRVTSGAEAGAEARDATGSLILPGLVNLHDHLRSLVPPTRASEALPLPAVVQRGAAASAAATAGDYRVLTAVGAARLLLSGVTSVIDHVYPVHVPGMIEATLAGHDSVGIRASLAVGILDDGPPAVVQDPAVTVDAVARLAGHAIAADRLFLAPVSLRQSSLDAYRAAVAAADRLGVRLYTHIAESADEVARCQADHDMRPVQLLHSLGFLRPGTILVHCVYLDDAERELLADTGTAVAYCPSNHLKFAKGFAPVRELLERGVPVGLGIDGMTDAFAEMREAVYAQNSAAGRTGAISSDTAFRMGTSAAASILGVEGLTGDLSPGDHGDAVVVSLDRFGLHPVADPLWTVVHRATGADVTDVFVGGTQVVRDRTLTLVDQHELADRARAVWAAIAVGAGLDPSGEQPPTHGLHRPGDHRVSRRHEEAPR